MNREEIEEFKSLLREWDFEANKMLPIRKKERDYLLKIFDQRDRESKKNHKWYLENKEAHNKRMKVYYQQKKAKGVQT